MDDSDTRIRQALLSQVLPNDLDIPQAAYNLLQAWDRDETAERLREALEKWADTVLRDVPSLGMTHRIRNCSCGDEDKGNGGRWADDGGSNL